MKKNQNLKVAMVGLRGINGVCGGVEMVVEHLSTTMVKRGVKVTIFCRSKYCPNKNKTFRGIELKHVPCVYTKHFESVSHTFLCSIIAAFSAFDIIHYHSIGSALMAWIPRIFGKKIVVTCHGLDWERSKWGYVAKKALRIGEKCSIIFPHATTVVSKMLYLHYKKEHNHETAYIPNGVQKFPLEKKAQSTMKRYKLNPNEYILFLSRIVPEKCLHLLITAFKKIKTNKKLVIVGAHSNSKKYYDKMVSISKDDKRIVFTGPLHGRDKNELFSNTYLFVLPSNIEGMPIVLLEAISFQCVPLVSDIPVSVSLIKREVIQRGYIFRKDSCHDLYTKLLHILNHQEEVCQIKAIPVDIFLKEYDWKNITTQYVDLYKKV